MGNINESVFLKAPNKEVTDVEKWAFYNNAEKEAKRSKEMYASWALASVNDTKNKFIKTNFGGAQAIEKVNRKAKDSLKFVIQQAGYYDMVRKDDIDLKKVDELIEAGMLEKEVIDNHIEISTSSYLKLK